MPSLQERFALVFGAPPARGVPARIARACQVSGATVSAWFNQPEKVATIERANAEKICAEFGLDERPEWLAEGAGPRKSLAVAGTISSPAPEPDSQPESSESFAEYVQDVRSSVEALAQSLSDAQRSALRNTVRVMLADRLNFMKLDLNHLLPLLSDNSYGKRLGKSPGQPLQPIRRPAPQSVTKMAGFSEMEQTDGKGTPPGLGDKRRH